jgi:hypothetical protein
LFSAASEADLDELWGELSKFGDPPDRKRQKDIKKSLKVWYVLTLKRIDIQLLYDKFYINLKS